MRVYSAILILGLILNTSLVLGLVLDEDWPVASNQWSICSWGFSCVPLSLCSIIKQLADSSCLSSSRSNRLLCGYRSGEAMVCCPETCPSAAMSRTSCGSQPVPTASQLAFPWAVRVTFLNKETGQKSPLCVGSIISKRVILTAAHCALAKTKSHKIGGVVLAGEEGSCCNDKRVLPLSHVVLHPAYRPDSFLHNLALLVLKKPLNFSRSVQPICLPAKNESILYSGQRSILAGWGRLSSGQYVDGVEKQEMVDLPLLPRSRCSQVYGSKVKITEDMICAGGEGKDACSGFGGAPLVVIHPSRADRYYQVGLVSFGADKCGTVGVPSVFTRVESYLEWIQANSPQDNPV